MSAGTDDLQHIMPAMQAAERQASDDNGATHRVPMHDVLDAAMDPDRPVSQLLLEHVEACRQVELTLPPALQTNIDISKIRTEAEASTYVLEVMVRLQPQKKATGGS